MLQVHEQRQVQTNVISLPWQLNRRTKTALQSQIIAAQKTVSQHLILDFSDVRKIDSCELHDLFLWYHKLKSQHLTISVINLPSQLRYHEDWTYLAEIVAIFRSLDDALEHVEGDFS